MYSYTELFVGIPLSQISHKLSKKSLSFIEKTRELVEKSDFKMSRVSEFSDVGKIAEELKLFMENIKNFNDRKDNEEFFDLIDNYELDFHADYSGDGDNPVIFGFYISELFKVSVFEITELNIDMVKINLLKDRFSRLAYYLLGDEIWNELNKDRLIGVFFNNHTS